MARRNKNGHTRKRSATTVSVTLEGLEIARGHDGLLRGEPEPVLVLCAFVVDEQGAECVLRHVERFRLEAAPPTLALPKGEATLKHRLSADAGRLLLLVVAALEEDAGDGVEEIFARLARPGTVSLFTVDQAVPDPQPAQRAASALSERGGTHEVHLLFEGGEASTLAGGDDWVGAAAVAVARAGKRQHLRLPFRAADGRNDWTLLLSLRA